MTQYRFELNTPKGQIGIEVVCHGLFEYKGETMQITNKYYNPDGTPDSRPTKQEQLQMAREMDRTINKYKLEH